MIITQYGHLRCNDNEVGIIAILDFQCLNVKCTKFSQLTACSDLRHTNPLLCGHEAQDREDDEASVEAGGTVDDRHHEGISQTIVMEGVVTGHSDESTSTCREGIEDLDSGVAPDLEYKIR